MSFIVLIPLSEDKKEKATWIFDNNPAIMFKEYKKR